MSSFVWFSVSEVRSYLNFSDFSRFVVIRINKDTKINEMRRKILRDETYESRKRRGMLEERKE